MYQYHPVFDRPLHIIRPTLRYDSVSDPNHLMDTVTFRYDSVIVDTYRRCIRTLSSVATGVGAVRDSTAVNYTLPGVGQCLPTSVRDPNGLVTTMAYMLWTIDIYGNGEGILGMTWDVERYYVPRGYRTWSVGENLLWSSDTLTAPAALRLWMQSPGHRKNILTAGWREIGISAVAVRSAPGVFGGRDVVIITTDFGTRETYVAEMKAAVLAVTRDVHLVDITHEIAAHDVVEGALALEAAAAVLELGGETGEAVLELAQVLGEGEGLRDGLGGEPPLVGDRLPDRVVDDEAHRASPSDGDDGRALHDRGDDAARPSSAGSLRLLKSSFTFEYSAPWADEIGSCRQLSTTFFFGRSFTTSALVLRRI